MLRLSSFVLTELKQFFDAFSSDLYDIRKNSCGLELTTRRVTNTKGAFTRLFLLCVFMLCVFPLHYLATVSKFVVRLLSAKTHCNVTSQNLTRK